MAPISVVDRHRFEADPDPDLIQNFTHVGKSEKFLLLFTAIFGQYV